MPIRNAVSTLSSGFSLTVDSQSLNVRATDDDNAKSLTKSSRLRMSVCSINGTPALSASMYMLCKAIWLSLLPSPSLDLP